MNIITRIDELVGNTPMYEMTTYPLPKGVRLFAKLEFYNPGGSIKDRLGFYLIKKALVEGLIKEGDTIIEPTAGNTGIGLALATQHFKVKAIFVTPKKFSMEKQTLMSALGATVVNTPTELGMAGAIEKAKRLAMTINGSYIPNQFHNEWNPETYYHSLGPEIYRDLEGDIQVFIAGAGSGGTFTGVAKYLKEKDSKIKTMIVEPEGSILNGGEPGPHDTEGIGMEFLPPFMDVSLFDRIFTISDERAFFRLSELAKNEGLFVGSSSGAVIEAALQIASESKPGTNIVTIFPDSSERYMSTHIYEERGVTAK